MDVRIRKAKPADARFVIPLIHSSGPHEFDYIFNVGHKTAHDYLSFAFPTRLGSQSHRVSYVAIQENQVIGTGTFYSGRDTVRLSLGNSWNVLRFYGPLHMMTVEQRASRVESMLLSPDAGAGLICQLGVKEEFRGRGIGSILIQYEIELARKLGLERCVLDVAMTNPRAQALYERMGFKVVQESKWRESYAAGHVPGQRRMELVL